MEQPITIRYRWTVAHLLQANRYHWRHRCRPVFRFLLHSAFTLILLGGIFGVYLLIVSPAGPGLWAESIVSVAMGVFWFTLRPCVRRWLLRRHFHRTPGRDMEFVWLVGSDKILTQSELGHSEVSWQVFTKAVRTPAGVLLYPNGQHFHWLPRHACTNDAEFAKLVALTKSKVPKYFDVD